MPYQNGRNLGLIAANSGPANEIPLVNLLEILRPLSNRLFVISINLNRNDLIHSSVSHFDINYETRGNIFTRIYGYSIMQLNLARQLVDFANNVNMWFFLKGDILTIPLVIAKILRKKTILIMGGNLEKELKVSQRIYMFKILKLVKRLNLCMFDKIILYSPNLIKEWNLTDYSNKIIVAPRHIIDFQKFNVIRNFNTRNKLVGFIGRLSEEKGIINFINAIPLVLKEKNDIQFFIAGDGILYNYIHEYLCRNHLLNQVQFVGWISHDKLPDRLNDLKLLVIPSYSEGLPNIMLEAMACGTPILASPVGSINYIIHDKENGFILENNSPEYLANAIITAIESPNLTSILGSALKLMNEEFGAESIIEKWRIIMQGLDEI